MTRFQAGDEVFGTGDGSFAEYAPRPSTLVLKPANLTFEQAAAVPTSSAAALQALRRGINSRPAGPDRRCVWRRRAVRSADREIVRGRRDCCVQHDAWDLVRSIGADRVIDYSREDFTQSGQQYDLILVMGGNQSLSQLKRVLRPGGTSCRLARTR